MARERIEVITRRERRRRWSVEQKLAIVAETHRPGVTVGEVARRHDVAPNLMFTQRQMAQGRPARRGDSFQLVPVHLAAPLNARGWSRTLRLARTIADLDRADAVRCAHVAEAVIYRRIGPGNGIEGVGERRASVYGM